MENNINELIKVELWKICREFQQERVNGQFYITQTGLNRVCKLLGGNYKDLTSKQRKILREHCIDASMGDYSRFKSWWYYLNCA